MVRNLTTSFILGLALAVGAANAGDYHRLTSLVCSDCHTMHYSVSHNYTNGGAPPPNNLGPGGPHAALLKAEPNELCLSCHDSQTFAPDVYGMNTGTHVREAGGMSTGAAPYENWKGHTLGADSAATIAPGGTWATGTHGLECVDCHAAHGRVDRKWSYGDLADPVAGAANGQWRNLNPWPGGLSSSTTGIRVTYAKVTNDPKADVFERDGTLGQVPTHYSIDNVDFNEPDPTKSAYGDWCKACHTNFHGSATDANMNNGADWVRHPTANANISTSATGRWMTRTNKVKVMTAAAANDFTPSCFSCHKSHGNQNPFGLIYMAGTGTVTEEGDSDGGRLANLCQQCHGMGTS